MMNHLHTLDPNPAATRAVLLLHGLGANASSWALQFAPLINGGFRPLAPDLPGFGNSAYDGRGWNIRRVSLELAALLDDLGLGQVDVVGLSLGGVIAQRFVLDFPARVHKLVLASSFAALRPERVSGWYYLLRRVALVSFKGIPEQARFVAERLFPSPGQEHLRRLLVEQVVQADPRAYRAAMRSLGWFDSRRALGRIGAPTLVITGECDGTVSPAVQRLLAEKIPHARQAIIAGAGHAVSVDHPVEFNRAMLDFLTEPDRLH